MGMFMGMDDMYIGGLLEVLNLRFGTFPDIQDNGADTLNPDERTMRLDASGIREMQAIQKEFEVFKPGRPLVQSLRALGIGGQWNNAMKRKWFKLLNRLDKVASEDPNLTGGQAIVAALAAHLGSGDLDPAPVYFKAHDATRQAGGAKVLITRNDSPLFYMDRKFLTISLPMASRHAQAPAPTVAPTPAPGAPTPPAGP